jgi:mRNA-decapping enzyme subunit 2
VKKIFSPALFICTFLTIYFSIFSQPEAEKNDLIRLFFQIELCHWFFLDFYCTQEENSIFVCGIKQFALNVFEHIPFLNHHVNNLNDILMEWRAYKSSVPTYGCILLTPDMKNCLLVQSFFAKNSWSFPKGKVNENEDPVKCAVREVYEETGFDCSHLIDENAFIEGQTSNYQYTRLYVVKNVPVDTKFLPRTRNEIKDCSWFNIEELPTSRTDDGYQQDQRKIRANSFYMILPFISKLKHWISRDRLARVVRNKNKQQLQQQAIRGHNKSNHKKNQIYSNKTFQQQSSSPYFQQHDNNHHNNNNNQLKLARLRNKSTSDVMDSYNNSTLGTFYNDHLKLQNNSSTPIEHNGQMVVQSSASAFRATNNLSSSFKKKQHQQQQQQIQKSNGKTNGLAVQSNQVHTKRRLFSESKENVHPTVKPFAFDIPESWKNFKFDHQKIFDSISM